jgi:hypothetical protein
MNKIKSDNVMELTLSIVDGIYYYRSIEYPDIKSQCKEDLIYKIAEYKSLLRDEKLKSLGI